MYNNLGVDWYVPSASRCHLDERSNAGRTSSRACTLLGCVCLLLAAIPIFFFRHGAKLRAMSRLVSLNIPVIKGRI